MNSTRRLIGRNRSWRTACLLGPGLAVLFLIGCVTGAGQPHMVAALGHLHSAQSELESAAANKGGHRERAIVLVNQAIAEVQAGIDYAAARY